MVAVKVYSRMLMIDDMVGAVKPGNVNQWLLLSLTRFY